MVIAGFAGRGWRRPVLCVVAGLTTVVVSTSRWTGASTPTAAPGGTTSEVVIASGELAAGRVLAASDMRVVAMDGPGPPSSVKDVSRLAGRRLVVAARPGDPILVPMTTAADAAPPGRRRVTLRLPGDAVPVIGFAGADVDVVEALDAQTSGSGHAEERVVAVATVESVDRAQAADGGAGAKATTAASSDPSAPAAVVLDCGSTDALRLLWAQDFAHSVRLVARPAGDAGAMPMSGASG